MKKTTLLPVLLLPILMACQPTTANRGSMLESEVLAQITPGVSTREDVAAKLGSPTSISTFDENVWYYMGRQTEQYSFFTPEVVKQQVVEIDFNDRGIVSNIASLDLPQAAEAAPVDRETPTYGQHNTIIRELLGDLSHPRPAVTQRGSGT